jgi:hypothetical protein
MTGPDHLTSAYAQAEAQYDLDMPRPVEQRSLTAGQYRAMTLRARRWANACLDAGEVAEAKHQLNEAARFSRMADEIEAERRAA